VAIESVGGTLDIKNVAWHCCHDDHLSVVEIVGAIRDIKATWHCCHDDRPAAREVIEVIRDVKP
jgi:hypothetical protein